MRKKLLSEEQDQSLDMEMSFKDFVGKMRIGKGLLSKGKPKGVQLKSGRSDSSDEYDDEEDDDDEEEEDLVDGDGFLAADSTLNLDGDVVEDDVEEQEAEAPVAEEEVAEEAEEEQPATAPNVAYEMLMSTCWIDGILDPAEAKLLARKREELGITFEQHLEMLQSMLERSS